MHRSSSTRSQVGAAVASTAAALLFAFSAPASAGERAAAPEHRSDPGAVTEANDNDGTPNNIVDDGDNLHPSGKDRSVEPGGSGDQGASASTPDQNGTGPERDYQGTDKPGGPGGIDVVDQDRNNGCGNDDDFEDDNEGWCGHKPTPETPEHPVTPPTPPKPGVVVAGQSQTPTPAPVATQVLGVEIERPTVVPASVLGTTAVRGATLARTGLDPAPLVALAGSLLLLGVWLRRAGRPPRSDVA